MYAKATRNRKKRIITITADFGHDPIYRLNLTAPDDAWRTLFNIGEDSYSMETIGGFLAEDNPAADVQAVRDYAADDPIAFQSDLSEAVWAAWPELPVKGKRKRTRDSMGFGVWERRRVKGVSKGLYVYLAHWLRKDWDSRPAELRTFLHATGLRLRRFGAKRTTFEIMKVIAPTLANGKIMDCSEETFYKEYAIGGKGLETHKRIFALSNYSLDDGIHSVAGDASKAGKLVSVRGARIIWHDPDCKITIPAVFDLYRRNLKTG